VETDINQRFRILDNEAFEIIGEKTLFLNFGDEKQAIEF
jgi:hypothetical protein